MGVTSVTHEIKCPITASRIFQALILDSNKLIPKLLPQFITSIDLIQGDGGVGSIEQVNFIQESNVKCVKHIIEELDKENFVCKYIMIEGDSLGEKVQSIGHRIQFGESNNGECICRMTSDYNTVREFEISEDEIKAGHESTMGIYKVVETYLLENPRAYALENPHAYA